MLNFKFLNRQVKKDILYSLMTLHLLSPEQRSRLTRNVFIFLRSWFEMQGDLNISCCFAGRFSVSRAPKR